MVQLSKVSNAHQCEVDRPNLVDPNPLEVSECDWFHYKL